MHRCLVRTAPIFVAAAALAASPRGAHGQLPLPTFSLVGGVSHYDLGASGTSALGALRVSVPLLTLVGEGSLAVFRPAAGGVTRTDIIPEAQLQWQLSPLLVRPYFGVGGGWVRAVSGPSPHPSDGTISAAVGARLGIPLSSIGVRGEVRVRAIGSGLSRHATELTLGVSW